MSYGTWAIGTSPGYGDGAKLLHFTQSQIAGMKAIAYTYQNVNYAPALSEDTEDGHMYVYQNVGYASANPEDTEDGYMYTYQNLGYAPAATENTEDGNMYIYENVQARPADSKEMLPPTHN